MTSKPLRRLLCGALIAACVASALASAAQACAVDGKPSAFANGVRAVIVQGAPTAATYAWWAHFAFAGTFRVGQPIRLREDDAQIRRVLRPEAVRRPWRWRLGDGAMVIGDQATHAFRHPGHFRVSVEAYFPGYGYLAFDAITLTVRP